MGAIRSVYFYCLPQGVANRPAYQYQSIVLAQGLKELGVKVYSNINYWKTAFDKNEFLFNVDQNIKPADCDVVVVPCQWRSYGYSLPHEVIEKNGSYKTVFIDVCDGLFTPSFEDEARCFDIILKQKTRGINYPQNCKYSWVFGLTNELIDITNTTEQNSIRNKSITVNFRHQHAIRDLAKRNFISKIDNVLKADATFESLKFSYDGTKYADATTKNDLLFMQSGGRHYVKYINRMQNSLACAAFGGNFMVGNYWEHNRLVHILANYFVAGRAGGKITSILRKFRFQKSHIYGVYQWDSWRFWESLACGCVTFHLDFEKYGIQLPVMPQNWKHYIGIDLNDPANDIERLNSLSVDDLKQIGFNGRQWALDNYSPKPTAQRFLSYLS